MIDLLLTQGLLDAVPDGLLVVDETGTVLFANRRMKDLSGYGPEQLLGQSVEMLIPEHERSTHTRQRSDYVHSGRPPRLMGVDLDTRLTRKDGTVIYVDIALNPLDPDGAKMVVATVRDATPRRRAEAVRNELERRMGELVENVELLVVGLDAQHKVFYVNPHFLRVTGYSSEEVVDTDWLDLLVDEEEKREVAHILDEVLAGREDVYFENHLRTRRGRNPLIGWFNVRLLEPDGGMAGVWKVGEDLTIRRLSEDRLKAANRVRRAILATNAEPDEAFNVIAAQAKELTEADLALVVTPTAGGYVARGAAGSASPGLSGTRLPTPTWREMFALREATALDSPRDLLPPGSWEALRPALVIPALQIETPAILLVARSRGPFDDQDITTLEQLAGLATVAMEYRHSQQRQRQLAVFDDRSRIARDLHDVVIQRLFAAGLAIQGARQKIDEQVVSQQLEGVVAEIDEAIAELRGSIFSLQSNPTEGLRDRVRDLLEDLAPMLQFVPEVEVQDGEGGVPDHILDELLATLREALTNVARHAQADHARIEIEVGTQLELVIEDDGRGLPEEVTRGNGLDNMQARARRLGGDVKLLRSHLGGLRLEWRVPISP